MKKAFGVEVNKHIGIIITDTNPFYEVWNTTGVYVVKQLRDNSGRLINRWVACLYPTLNWFLHIVTGSDTGKRQDLSSWGSYEEAKKAIEDILKEKGISLKYPQGYRVGVL